MDDSTDGSGDCMHGFRLFEAPSVIITNRLLLILEDWQRSPGAEVYISLQRNPKKKPKKIETKPG